MMFIELNLIVLKEITKLKTTADVQSMKSILMKKSSNKTPLNLKRKFKNFFL